MSNKEILELRSKLFGLGIKTKWYDSISQGNPTPMLEHYNKFMVVFGGGDTQTFDISDMDGNVSSFVSIDETIQFINNLK